MIKVKVNHIHEDGWIGEVDNTSTWSDETKEALFMKMLKTNNRLQKEFDGNRNSYEFADYDMQDEYDAWWVALGNEQRAKIFAES